jgi:dipeptidase D
MDTIGYNHYKGEPVLDDMTGFEVSVTGLHGGHSGDEIHKGYGYAIKIMNRILSDLDNRFDISISTFNVGNLHECNTTEAFAIVAVRNHLRN